MKHTISLMIFVAAAVFFLGTSAYGQEVNVHVVVPFDFIVAGTSFPAGDYVIKTAATNTFALSLMNAAGRVPVIARSYPCTSPAVLQPATQTKLVFHRINDVYFLYQVGEHMRCQQRSRAQTVSLMGMLYFAAIRIGRVWMSSGAPAMSVSSAFGPGNVRIKLALGKCRARIVYFAPLRMATSMLLSPT